MQQIIVNNALRPKLFAPIIGLARNFSTKDDFKYYKFDKKFKFRHPPTLKLYNKIEAGSEVKIRQDQYADIALTHSAYDLWEQSKFADKHQNKQKLID